MVPVNWLNNKLKKVSCVNNPISVGMVFPTADHVLMYVVDRHVVKLVMLIKLHATDNCSLIGRVVVGVVGVVMGMLGALLGTLDNGMTGRMVGIMVGMGVFVVVILGETVGSVIGARRGAFVVGGLVGMKFGLLVMTTTVDGDVFGAVLLLLLLLLLLFVFINDVEGLLLLLPPPPQFPVPQSTLTPATTATNNIVTTMATPKRRTFLVSCWYIWYGSWCWSYVIVLIVWCRIMSCGV